MRYLLFSSVGTIPISDTPIKNPASSPPIHPKPNPNPNFIPTSKAFLLPCAAEHSLRRSTPLGAVGQPRAKTNNSADANFQPTPNTQEATPITAHDLTPRLSKLKKRFADEIATYTSIIAGFNTFSYMIKFANLNPAIQMLSFGRFPQWSLYLILQK